MIFLGPLPHRAHQYYEAIARAKRGEVGALLLALRPTILNAYREYQIASPNIETLNTLVLGPKEVAALHAAFQDKELDDLERLRLDLNGACRGALGLCCYCEIDSSTQLDHVLPLTPYPQYSVCSVNLVPSCGLCNQKKQANIEEGGERIFVHMHSEALPDERWLFAVAEGSGPTSVNIKFELRPSAHVDRLYGSLLASHYRKFDLINRFGLRLTELIADASSRAGDTPLDIAASLKRNAKSLFRSHGKNFYRAVALEALSLRPELVPPVDEEVETTPLSI